MTNMHAAIPEEKLTEAYRLLLEMRENCAKHADDQYDDPKREAKCEALNIAIAAMGRSIPSRWIPVEERLPEHGKNVLVHVANRVGMWHTEIDWQKDNGEWANNADCEWYTITHWMPLPEPPEEG